MYNIALLLGNFAIMVVLMIVAILTAKRKICWLFYAIGGVFQFLSQVGQSQSLRRAHYYYSEDYVVYLETTNKIYWVMYIILMIVFTILISRRAVVLMRKAEKELATKLSQERPAHGANDWQCSCGRWNADYTSTCTCGVKKRDMKQRLQ